MSKTKISKDSILRVSLKMFLEKGYKKTTIRMIANELEISHGSLFNYFDSKAAIANEILSSFYDIWFKTTEETAADIGINRSLDFFSLLAIINFSFADKHPEFAVFIRDFIAEDHPAFLDSNNDRLIDYVRRFSGNYNPKSFSAGIDVLLLDTASSYLYTLILSGRSTIHDACVYITGLDNYLWNLGFTSHDVEESIDRYYKLPEIDTAVTKIQKSFES